MISTLFRSFTCPGSYRLFSSKPLPLSQAVKDARLRIFDVTSVSEFQETKHLGLLPRADVVNLPIADLAASVALLGTQKDVTLIFYCKHGVRAGMAAGFAQRSGFLNAFAMTDAEAVKALLKEFNK